MKKYLSIFFIFLWSLSFAQVDDEPTRGDSSVNYSSGSSGGAGLSLDPLDACGCTGDPVLDLAIIGVVAIGVGIVWGIQENTAYIKKNHAELPRLKNAEFNLRTGVSTRGNGVVMPQLRLQAGVLGASFRSHHFMESNPSVLTRFETVNDVQLEFNVVNTKSVTARFGGGMVFKQFAQNEIVLPEFTIGTDIFLLEDKLRYSLEGRSAFRGGGTVRSEINSRIHYRPWISEMAHFEVFTGATYYNFYSRDQLFTFELGTGLMIY